MTVSFNTIPTALRYPGAYIEIDGSQAGLGEDIPAVLLVGQKLAAGTAPAGEITLVSSVEDAVAKAGYHSALADMARAYRAGDKVLDVYMLPLADNPAGVQATASITVAAAPTQTGTLALYMAGKRINVGITAGMTVAAAAQAIADAITAAALVQPLLATPTDVTGAVVTLTCVHKGTIGNDIDLRLNVYGERTPNGLGLTIAGFADGAGDPVLPDLDATLGNRWYKYIALGNNDNATLAAWHALSQARYQPPVQQGFRAFGAFRGDYASAVTKGDSLNYEHICLLSLGINPTTPWEAAAQACAAAAPKLYNNPVESLEGKKIVGMVGINYHSWTQANSLLFKGMSILEIAKDGSCYIKRLISTYTERPDGSTDDAYLDINTAETLERIRYEQRIGAIKRFVGTAAAKTNEGYRPGLRITTEDDVRAYLLDLYKTTLIFEKGWAQNYDYYKANLVVEQDADNPSRFNFVDMPVILSPYYILAGRTVFRKVAE